MRACAIDGNALSGLFDNQQKLDDLFDSIFEDDNYFISSSASSVSITSDQGGEINFMPIQPSSWLRASRSSVKQYWPYGYVLPLALEIAVIYFVVTHF